MTEQEFNTYSDMFATDGWKLFIKSVEELEDGLTKSAVNAAPANDQWQYLRGQLNQLRSIIGYENYIHVAYENQEQEDNE